MSSMRPFPSSSMPFPAVSPGLVQMLSARSGCVCEMPLSITATCTEELPVLWSQASGASMSASATPAVEFTVWPVLWRPQSEAKLVSFGVASSRRMKFGSA
jgi:hypothetical protein